MLLGVQNFMFVCVLNVKVLTRGGWTRSEKAHGSKNRPIRNAEIEINN